MQVEAVGLPHPPLIPPGYRFCFAFEPLKFLQNPCGKVAFS
jgi:hypothetical protein